MTPTKRNDLRIIVYAPALVCGDSRPLSVIRGMERAFPGLHLGWTISDEGRLVSLPQRDAWVSQQRTEGERPDSFLDVSNSQLVECPTYLTE